MKTPTYKKESVIVSFWETIINPYGEEEMKFQKRYYPSESKAREYISKLICSNRMVKAIQLKTNYIVNVKEEDK